MQSIISSSGVVADLGALTPGVDMKTDPSYGSGRINIRALENVFGGRFLSHRHASTASLNVLSLPAASVLLELEWGYSSRVCILLKLVVGAILSGAFTGQVLDVEARLASAFTSVDPNNGTNVLAGVNRAILMDTNGQTNSNPSVFELRRLTNLTNGSGMVNGTYTVSPVAFGAGMFPNSNVNGQGGTVQLYSWDALGQHPIVIGHNEGFVVRTITAYSGPQVNYYYDVEWAEMEAF